MTLPWTTPPSLEPDVFQQIRMRTMFECGKWDLQVEDVSVLAPFALVLRGAAWAELAELAEKLAAETVAAEIELADRPDLHGELGLSRPLRRALRGGWWKRGDVPPGIARLMRFDFHLSTNGWRITEVNSDVPGGFIESGGFTRLMADHYPDAVPTGDPAAALAEALRRQLPAQATVALVHATAYTDDRQVMLFLARAMESARLRPVLVAPDNLRWVNGRASVDCDWHAGPADAVVRFFPGEWLINLPNQCGWQNCFRGVGLRTPQCNPATALLTQTKRFPLVWDRLRTPLPTWRALLPRTVDPRTVNWRSAQWVLKPALGRVGEDVVIHGITPPREWKRIERDVRWHGRWWAAQEKFEAVPIEAGGRTWFPCLGVWTIDGRACGIYGRIAPAALIDGKSCDVAVLVEAQPAPNRDREEQLACMVS